MKVLIVEDDPSSQDYLKAGIESEGHKTWTADNGKIGFKLYEKVRPDLVLSDIKMPVMDGFELLKVICNQNEATIVVLITAFGCEEYAVQALRAGANNYLNKPVRHTELLNLLQKYNSIIENRTIAKDILGKIIRRSFTMKFDNHIHLVPQKENLRKVKVRRLPSESSK